jgi:hypothetical protein
MNEHKDELHEFTGEERRSIPVHVLNYMDHKLDEHTQRIENLFKEHIADEAQKHSAVIYNLEVSAKASQSRHAALMTQFNMISENIEEINNAFPKSKEGLPGYEEHHNYHFTWRTRKEWWAGTSNQAFRKLFEWLLMAFVIWLGAVIWQSILTGPK